MDLPFALKWKKKTLNYTYQEIIDNLLYISWKFVTIQYSQESNTLTQQPWINLQKCCNRKHMALEWRIKKKKTNFLILLIVDISSHIAEQLSGTSGLKLRNTGIYILTKFANRSPVIALEIVFNRYLLRK